MAIPAGLPSSIASTSFPPDAGWRSNARRRLPVDAALHHKLPTPQRVGPLRGYHEDQIEIIRERWTARCLAPFSVCRRANPVIGSDLSPTTCHTHLAFALLTGGTPVPR
jgi:hypothetical protein